MKRRNAFTLVELLVVIGIISAIVGILLPTLGKARAQANSVKCMSNLRSIGQSLAMYTNAYKGNLPGSANTSSRHFYSSTYALVLTDSNNIPLGSPIEAFDFVTPLQQAMGLKWTADNSPLALTRYIAQAESQQFHCPSAEGLIGQAFPLGSGPDTRIVSYNTANTFLMTEANPKPGNTGYTRMSSGIGWWVLPGAYFPKITKIGKTTEKIYAADGAKNTYLGGVPQYNISTQPLSSASTGNQSKYTDWGAFTINTSSYDQWSGSNDGRVSSYRHGKQSRGGRAGEYKLNAVFFDGHVETLSDKEATHPKFWVPAGTTFPDLSKIHPSVQQLHKINAGYVAP